MFLFLILFWALPCWAMRRPGHNSRFDVFNSRLGRREFPVRTATGICRQRIDLLYAFIDQTAVGWGKSKKFPVRREKPGFLLAPSAQLPCDGRGLTPRSTWPGGGGGRWPRLIA